MAPRLRPTSRARRDAAAGAAIATAVANERANNRNHNHDEDSMDVDVDVDVDLESQVKLKSSDGKRFTLTHSEASCSNTLRTMIESYQNEHNTSADVISLPSVRGDILAKVVSWCKMHPYSEPTDAESDELTDWDKHFLGSFPEEDLFRLMHAANYLNVETLLDACCRKVAKFWEGKKVEEIRKMYSIENDFPADEEHQMLMESKRLGMDN